MFHKKEPYLVKLLAVFFLALGISAINPHDYFTWFLEVIPALIALVVLALTYKRFRFTNFTYTVILIHAIILMIGGHYTYAEVPLFNWLKETFDLSRNYYDRVGHFMQGFGPMMVMRDIVVRREIIRGRFWQGLLMVFTVLGFSAFYEFTEWWAAVGYGDRATDFLGTQGDVWDTQWDMFMCFTGSIISLLTLSKVQDRELLK